MDTTFILRQVMVYPSTTQSSLMPNLNVAMLMSAARSLQHRTRRRARRSADLKNIRTIPHSSSHAPVSFHLCFSLIASRFESGSAGNFSLRAAICENAYSVLEVWRRGDLVVEVEVPTIMVFKVHNNYLSDILHTLSRNLNMCVTEILSVVTEIS